MKQANLPGDKNFDSFAVKSSLCDLFTNVCCRMSFVSKTVLRCYTVNGLENPSLGWESMQGQESMVPLDFAPHPYVLFVQE